MALAVGLSPHYVEHAQQATACWATLRGVRPALKPHRSVKLVVITLLWGQTNMTQAVPQGPIRIPFVRILVRCDSPYILLPFSARIASGGRRKWTFATSAWVVKARHTHAWPSTTAGSSLDPFGLCRTTVCFLKKKLLLWKKRCGRRMKTMTK